MSDLSGEEQVEGSWLPFIAVAAMVFIWWLTSSQSQSAVKLRRSYQMQVRYCAPPSQDNDAQIIIDHPADSHMFLSRDICLQRVQLKKKIGLRDESIYNNFSAGDGANQRHKRQG
jgi:hypothetical protein